MAQNRRLRMLAGSGELASFLDNETTSNPTADDDSGDGYAIGSQWINTSSGAVFVATDVTSTAAVWATLGATAQDLQAVTDVGAETTAGVGLGGGTVSDAHADADNCVVGTITDTHAGYTTLIDPAGYGHLQWVTVSGTMHGQIRYNAASQVLDFWFGGTNRYGWKYNQIYPNANLGSSLGNTVRFWKWGYISSNVGGVQIIGDASDTISYYYEIYITRGAGTNNATLPTAFAGTRFKIHVTGGGAGTVNLVSAAGDSINGGSVPTTVALQNGLHAVTALDATDWQLHQISTPDPITFTEYDNGDAGASISIYADNGQKQKVLVTEDTTITPVAPSVGIASFRLRIVMDATGGWAVTWSGTNQPGVHADISALTANQYTLAVFEFDDDSHINVQVPKDADDNALPFT